MTYAASNNVALDFQTSVGVELYVDLDLDIVGFDFDTNELPIFVSPCIPNLYRFHTWLIRWCA